MDGVIKIEQQWQGSSKIRSRSFSLAFRLHLCKGRQPISMSVTTATEAVAPADLISFFKAIPDGRSWHRVRYPQWILLLVAVLSILSGCKSSRDQEAFAKRHRKTLN
jgi:hypothetical protein